MRVIFFGYFLFSTCPDSSGEKKVTKHITGKYTLKEQDSSFARESRAVSLLNSKKLKQASAKHNHFKRLAQLDWASHN